MLTRLDPVVPPDYHTASQRGATEHCSGTPHSCGSGAAQFNVLPDKSGVPAETMQLCLSQCQGAALLDSNSKMALASTPVATYSSRSFVIKIYATTQRHQNEKGRGQAVQDHRHRQSSAPPRRQTPPGPDQESQAPPPSPSVVVVDATDAYRITQNLPFSH